MKNVKNRSKYHEKMAVVFVIIANLCLGNAKTELPLLTLTNRVKEARPSKNIMTKRTLNFEAGNGN